MGHSRKEPMTVAAAADRRATKDAKKDIRMEESREADKKRGR